VLTATFDYELPEALIASRPTEARDGARLCVVGSAGVEHRWVSELAELLAPGDLVVVNETRVRRARLLLRRPAQGGRAGGRVELLMLSRLGQHTDGSELWEALGRANRPLRPGDRLEAGSAELVVVERGSGGTVLVAGLSDGEALLEREGQMPIPPYLRRAADEVDVQRYQTVYARELGSAAAPTAGLHLTSEAITTLERRGVRLGRALLHVGVGTFRPVEALDLDDHPMHAEWYSVGPELAAEVAAARARGGRVVAIGTTTVRALEAARDALRPGHVLTTGGETRLLIQPGYRFGVVDALLTNFHQPRSTLLALVAALAGTERVLGAYREAVREGYRFLSYGDAMWIPGRLAELESP
jgi:S-adenosylmethionine:tRNA ribosyltransferase-isomerase